MQVKKFISFIIVTVVLTVLSLPISFAINTTSITSPLTEPEPYLKTVGDHIEVCVYYVVNRPEDVNELYELKASYPIGTSVQFCFTFPNGNTSNQRVRLWSDNLPILITGTTNKYGSHLVYDIITGNLIEDGYVLLNQEAGGYTLSFRQGYFPRRTGIYDSASDFNYGYPIIPSNLSIYTGNYPDVLNVSPYVTWSTEPPEQETFRSTLSEPVADKYNSYAVLDDRLIWISYRINGIYTRSASIENISEVYSYNAQIIESGTGTYAGQQNGYTENIEIPSQSISGYYSGSSEETSILTDGNFDQFGFYRGTEYDVGSGYTNSSQGELYLNNLYLGDMQFSGNHSGIISGTSLGNIDFSGVNTGNVHFNSNGSVSLNDIEYYPVSFNHNDIFEYFRLYCLPTSNNNFVFWLAPDRSFVPIASTNQLLVNMDFYYSEFDLDGNYIRSTFHTVTETDIGLFDAYQTEESVHSIRFYGIDFFNFDNLPFNLSSILWQYDFEFKEWRDNMLVKLNDIYNLLAHAQDMPEPGSYDQWGNELNEYESNYSNMSPEQVNIVLKNALGNGRYDNAASQIKAWINNFSIGELIAVCVFALALGTVTLTLGKKKSD